MAQPLIPDRIAHRSLSVHWSDRRSGASDTRRRVLVGTAVVAVSVLAVGVAAGSVPPPAAAAIALMVPAAVIDVERRRLPDAWVLGSLLVLVAALAVDSAVGQPIDAAAMARSIAGGATAMMMPVLALHLLSPASMGFGDVKAAAVLGAAVGTIDWRLGVVALCIAALTGAAIGLSTRNRTIAFGPALVFGAGLCLLAHQSIADVAFTTGVSR